jgi:hypothetical protein
MTTTWARYRASVIEQKPSLEAVSLLTGRRNDIERRRGGE